MKNIALYGGAFDPPHVGHIRTIESLCKAPGIDEVWLLPCGDREDKKLLLPTKIRFQLMKNLFRENNRIKVSEDEIEMSRMRGGQIHTYDLLNQFKKKYEWGIFHFVIGADILHSIHSWGNAQKLVNEHNFIVFNRKGYLLDKNMLPKHSQVIENQSLQISSTYLKQIIRDNNLGTEQKRHLLEPWLHSLVIECLRQNKII